ncbi:MAG: hypothetical protein ACI4QE_05120, partial [Acutalibacteraceae bacterium]
MESERDEIIIYGGTKGKNSSFFRDLFADTVLYFESLLNEGNSDSSVTKKLKIFSFGSFEEGEKGYCFLFRGKTYLAVPAFENADDELFDKCILEAKKVIEENSVLFPNGIKLKEKVPKKKKKFSSYFLPQPLDSKREVLRKLISILAVIAIVISGSALSYNLIFKSIRNDMVQSEVQDIFHGDEQINALSAS